MLNRLARSMRDLMKIVDKIQKYRASLLDSTLGQQATSRIRQSPGAELDHQHSGEGDREQRQDDRRDRREHRNFRVHRR